MEDKYISVNSFKETLSRLTVEGGNKEFIQGIVQALSEAVPKLLDDEPAADVQPVKHGRWIGEEVIQCSNCNFTLNGTSYGRIVHKYFSYCPKCGTRMDGGAE